jgi:NADH dehydrogenase [ubiquinone] 1 alpha subcomplex assembly factor 7
VTANVDFALLKEALSDLVTPHRTLSQGTFLSEVGIQLRAERLVKAAPTEERKTAIVESVHRLVDPLGMGGQYAVLGVTTTPKEEAVWPFLHTRESLH